MEAWFPSYRLGIACLLPSVDSHDDDISVDDDADLDVIAIAIDTAFAVPRLVIVLPGTCRRGKEPVRDVSFVGTSLSHALACMTGEHDVAATNDSMLDILSSGKQGANSSLPLAFYQRSPDDP